MTSWTVPVLCVISVVVLCGALDNSESGDGYIHGHPLNGVGARGSYLHGRGLHGHNLPISGIRHHGQNPLLSGSGIRGFSMSESGYPRGYHGYNNEESNYGENQNKKSSHRDGEYNPKGHSGYNYSPYQHYQGYNKYGKTPDYYHNHQPYPYYPDYFKNGHPAYHPLPHPHYPRPYGYNHYANTKSAETEDSSEEVDSVLKVLDEREIFVHLPQDKVLYIPRSTADVKKEEKEQKEKEEERKKEEEKQDSSSQESEESKSELEEEAKLVKKTEEIQEDVKEEVGDEFSVYLSGYSSTAPIALDNSFCEGLADGNFANPGLTKDADPRCTYITCAGERPIIFNCAPGTYNGRHIDYHTPVWASSSPNYKGAPHHRFTVYGRDFCGQRDIGTFTKGPVCSGRLTYETKEKRKDPSSNSVLPKDTMSEEEEDKDTYKYPEGKSAVVIPIEINDIHKIHTDDMFADDDNETYYNDEMTDDSRVSSHEVEEVQTEEDEGRGEGESEETPDAGDRYDESESVEIEDEQGPTPIPEAVLEAKEPSLHHDTKFLSHSAEYSDYNRGYGEAPIVLKNNFCANMEDGNYANPGLTRDVDPRCTYITCSSKRGYIFNCPFGTFNGENYKHHYPAFGSDITSYTDAYHYQYKASGFCDVNDYKLVCTP